MSPSATLCQADQSVLLVIDIQQRLAGAMPEKVLQRVIKQTSYLLQAADSLGIPVIRTEQYPKGLGPTMDSVQQHIKQECHLEKTSFSCTGADGFDAELNRLDRTQIILAGMESHVCVLQTAMLLQQNKYDVFIASDAVCSRDKHSHKNALQRMSQAGIVISNAESIMFEWLRDASHPQFKAISSLLR